MLRELQLTLSGIPVRVGRLWVVVVAVLIAITVNSLAPTTDGGWELVLWYGGAAVVVVGLFASLLAHELAHARAARTAGGEMHSIILPLFGALSDRAYAPVSPRSDALVALAGPIINLLAALIFGAAWWLADGKWNLLAGVLGVLALINLTIAIANLMPGLPMDGGRVLRAFIWYLTDDILAGTRLASFYGNFIAILGIISGLVLLSLGDTLSIWGAWALLAFWTINREGRESYTRLAWHEASKSISVADAGLAVSRRTTADRTIDDALDDLLRTVDEGPMLVDDQGEITGIVNLSHIRRIPRANWTTRSIRDATQPLDLFPRVSSDDTLHALMQLFETSRPAIVVIESDGRITGAVDEVITANRIRARVREERAERLRRT
jgi:Zn-dependent protease